MSLPLLLLGKLLPPCKYSRADDQCFPLGIVLRAQRWTGHCWDLVWTSCPSWCGGCRCYGWCRLAHVDQHRQSSPLLDARDDFTDDLILFGSLSIMVMNMLFTTS